MVVYEKGRLPVFKLIPDHWDDVSIKTDINNNWFEYDGYISPSDTKNTHLKRISINANLSYTKEVTEAYFIYCSITYWPIAYEFIRGIPFVDTYYEMSPYSKLMAQRRWVVSQQLVFQVNGQSFS